MNKTYLHPDIFYIEDFLTKEETSSLYNECINSDWVNPKWISVNSTIDSQLKKEWLNRVKCKNIKLMRDIRDRCNLLLENNDGSLTFTFPEHLRRVQVGDVDLKGEMAGQFSLSPHHDAATDPWIAGSIIYLNDDYLGGELNYINLGIKIKPKPGTLVFHKTGMHCIHAVEKVEKGTRYMITMFAGDKTNDALKKYNLNYGY
jgi:hypothetical protein